MTVIEGGEYPANYSIRPTIPILCPIGWDEPGGEDCPCDLRIEVHEPIIDEPGTPPAVCGTDTDQTIAQTVVRSDTSPTDCTMLLHEVAWAFHVFVLIVISKNFTQKY